jgi:hypothetical protein
VLGVEVVKATSKSRDSFRDLGDLVVHEFIRTSLVFFDGCQTVDDRSRDGVLLFDVLESIFEVVEDAFDLSRRQRVARSGQSGRVAVLHTPSSRRGDLQDHDTSQASLSHRAFSRC